MSPVVSAWADVETVTQFSWDFVGARTDSSWLWNAETDNPGIGWAAAMFRAAQKLWDNHHLTVCGWHSVGLVGKVVSASRSDSLSAEAEGRRERKERQGKGSGGRKTEAQCYGNHRTHFGGLVSKHCPDSSVKKRRVSK